MTATLLLMTSNFTRLSATAALCAALSSMPVSAAEPQVKILTSIKPIQLIAASMLGDHAQVDVLMPPGSSPHHYSLKPSSIRRMHDTDLFVWVGEDLELFLRKPVSQLDRPALALLPEEESLADEHKDHGDHDEGHKDHDDHGHHEDEHKGHDDQGHHDDGHKGHDDHGHHEDEHKDHDDHGHHDEHKDHAEHDEHEEDEHAGHEHHHHGRDPHLWMAPELALEAAERIRDRLIADYPEHTVLWQQDYAQFEQKVVAADKRIAEQLKAVQQPGFFVFHDAFGSYMEHYGMNQLGYFTVDPGRKPGAKRLAEIRTALEQQHATCIFVEPQFKAPVVDSLTRGLDVNVGQLDPLAIETAVNSGGYVTFLQSMADNLTACLSKK